MVLKTDIHPSAVKGLATSLTLFVISALVSFSAAAFQTEKPHTTAMRYDTSGKLTGIINPDPDGSGSLGYLAIRNTYNAQGLLVRVEHGELAYWLSEGIKPADWYGFSRHSEQVFTYDDRGRRVSVATKDLTGSTISFSQMSYDIYDRLECSVVRLNKALFNSFSTGACISTRNSNGEYDRVTKYTYDDIGQVLIVYKAFDTPLQQAYKTNEYDSSTRKKGLLKSVKDANGNKTSMLYDYHGRVQKIFYPDFRSEHFEYDANGNVIKTKKRNGALIEYQYDRNNRLTFKNYVDNTSILDVSYRYDLRGLPLQTTAGSYGEKKWVINSFDGFGNLKETKTAKGYYPTLNVRKLSYEYDDNGNRTIITHPDGHVFRYEYDGADNLVAIRENSDTTLLVQSYNPQGQRHAITRTGGANTNYGFDGIGRLKTFTQNFSGTNHDLTTTFAYNPASQIISQSRSNSAYVYTGNRNITGNYSVNRMNQYTGAGGKVVRHDNNGNTTNDGDTAYTYDTENRLLSASGQHVASLQYDPLGRLEAIESNGTHTRFLYDGDALVAEYNGSGTVIKRYVHGSGIDEPLVEYHGSGVNNASRRFLHANQQGSIIAVSNNTGSVTNTNS